jgi:hypothetical protein
MGYFPGIEVIGIMGYRGGVARVAGKFQSHTFELL